MTRKRKRVIKMILGIILVLVGRQVEEIDGVEMKLGWRCDYDKYEQKDGIKRVTSIRSVKILPDREVVYFSSDDFHIEYLK